MRKRLTSILLLAAIILTLIPIGAVPVFATNVPTITVGSAAALPGETVQIPVTITGNTGILGAKLTFTYDVGLTLTAAKAGEAFSALTMTKPGQFTSPCSFTWDGQELEASDIKDGTILTLTFQVADTAAVGAELPITVSYAPKGIVDGDLNPVAAVVQNGKVTVTTEQPAATAILSAEFEAGNAILTINAQSAIENAHVIVAAYAENGAMKDVAIRMVALQQGMQTYSLSCALDGDVYKVFLLDSAFRPLCAFYSVTAQQPDNTAPSLSVSSANAKAGSKSVAVSVSVRNNPGILGMKLTLSYDDSVLTLQNASNGAAFDGVLTMTKPRTYQNGCNFVWDGIELSPDDVKDGEILTLVFDVADSAAAGTYPVRVFYANKGIVDEKLNPITLTVTNGSIRVAE